MPRSIKKQIIYLMIPILILVVMLSIIFDKFNAFYPLATSEAYMICESLFTSNECPSPLYLVGEESPLDPWGNSYLCENIDETLTIISNGKPMRFYDFKINPAIACKVNESYTDGGLKCICDLEHSL